MKELFFICPYCWQEISMLLDPSATYQSYVEDCEVCCNPIEIAVQFRQEELELFEARKIEQ